MNDFHSQAFSKVNLDVSNLKESIEMLQVAAKIGYKRIIITPIYSDTNHNVATYEQNYIKLEKILVENKININIYLGGEIEYFPEIVSFLDDHPQATINRSRYVLVKFPLKDSNFYMMIEGIFQLEVAGYRPILSNVERYDFIIDNPQSIKEFILRDVIIQLDSLSLLGEYGTKAKKTAKILLKNDAVHILGTNAKTIKDYQKSIHANKKVKKIIGEKKFDKIAIESSERILEGSLFYPEQPDDRKKNIFGFGTAT